jgi:hypothetical protein
MSFNIIDKNPRKPRVEGPKAQERYMDELMGDWVGNHGVHAANAREDRHPEMTANERARMLAEAEKHLAELRDKGVFDTPTATATAIELDFAHETRPEVVAARRGMFLVKKLAYQEQAYGYCHIEDLDELAECKRIVAAYA